MRRFHTWARVMLIGCALAGCTQEPALTQAGDINLAGCEVPAGLTPEAAEAIDCAPSSSAAAPATPAVAALVAAADVTPDADVIDAAIAAQARKDGGSEFVEGRASVEGDLTGDGASDLAVLFTLEGAGGGNGAVRYLAAFAREAGQLTLVDTTSFSGGSQGIDLKDGAVHLKLLVLGPDDSACCPSVEEDTTYVLHRSKWLQVRSQS
jgi:hypothetical protein